MKMMRGVFAGVLLSGLIVFVGCDDDDENEANVNDNDRTFVTEATYSNRAEIELGGLAASRAQSDDVKMFGGMMVEDHTTAQTDLNAIASSSNVNLDTPEGIKQEDQQLKDRLSALSGYQFDTAYINSQVIAHKRAEALFLDEINDGRNQELRDYASDYLTAIRQHLQDAEELKETLDAMSENN